MADPFNPGRLVLRGLCALLFFMGAAGPSGFQSATKQAAALPSSSPSHNGAVLSVAFSPDGLKVASSSADHTVRLWEVHTGRQLLVLSGHTAMAPQVLFSPDGRYVVSSSLDHSIRIWDSASGNLVRVISQPENVVPLAIAPDGRLLASACGFRSQEGGCQDPSIALWKFPGGESAGKLIGHNIGVRALAFSPDGRLLASAGEDRTVRLWSVAIGSQVQSIPLELVAYGLTFSPDGKRLAVQETETVHVIEAPGGRQLHSLRQPYGGGGVAFAPDGGLLASTGSEPHITLWNATTWSVARRVPSESLNCRGVAFSPDGKLLAAACSDATVKLYEVSSLHRLRTLGKPAGSLD